MSLVTDLIVYLKTQSSVTDLATGGFFDLTAPNTALAGPPCIIVDTSDYHAWQRQQSPTEMGEARMQVMCISNSQATARAMADAVRLVTDGFSGSWDSTTIKWCNVEDIGDGITVPDVGGDVSTPDVTLSLIVHYTLSVPSYS